MGILAVLLIFGALWLGYKIGMESGRNNLLDAQSRSIVSALGSQNDFFKTFGIHGHYLLEGHEHRTPHDFVIVKFSDFERSRGHDNEGQVEDARPSDSADGSKVPDEQVQSGTIVQMLLVPSAELAAIVGGAKISLTGAAKKVWEYIEENGLRNGQSRSEFICDGKLQALTGASTCTPFLLTKAIRENLS